MHWNEMRAVGLEPLGRLPKSKSDKPSKQPAEPPKRKGPAPQFKHGTVHMYRRYGCRCEPCRKAQSDKQREYRNKWARNSGPYKRSERPRKVKPETTAPLPIPKVSVPYSGPDWTTQEYHPLPNTGLPLEKHEPNFPAGTFACPECSTQLRTEIERCWFCGHAFLEPKTGPYSFNYRSARQLDCRLNLSANKNRSG